MVVEATLTFMKLRDGGQSGSETPHAVPRVRRPAAPLREAFVERDEVFVLAARTPETNLAPGKIAFSQDRGRILGGTTTS